MPQTSGNLDPSPTSTTTGNPSAATISPNQSTGLPANSVNNNNNNEHNNNSSSSSSSRQQRATSNMSAGMSRVLAHSTSVLANDSYIAGMSSDSELTSSRHGHHRPYSSQSRVYHAHPAPRSSQTSSRVSHYSDSAAATYGTSSANKLPSYDANSSLSSGSSTAATPGQQQYLSHNHPRSVGNPHLTPQGSLASSRSVASSSSLPGVGGPYYQTTTATSVGGASMSDSSAKNTIMSGSPQQQQQQPQQPGNMSSPSSSMVSSRPLIAPSGRQLPHRPFKQSLSIDHHNTSSQHQHMMGPTGAHHHLGNISARAPLSPHHFDSVDMSTTYQQQQQQQSQLDNPQHQRLLHHDQITRYDQRGFRSDFGLIEKQTAALRLYDSSDTSSLASLANRVPAPTSSSPRHLSSSSPVSGGANTGPSTSGQASSSLHLQQQQQQQQQQQHQYHPLDHHQATNQPSPNQLARNQSQLHHHSSDLYAAHLQYSSSPADWLPPVGLHHSNMGPKSTTNPVQFKQTLSIDHYPVAVHSQQQQPHQYYSPIRQGFRDHYSSMGYSSTNSPVSGYNQESPTHNQTKADYVQQQQQSAPGSFDNQSSTPATGDIIYHQYAANPDHQHLAENTFRGQLHESTRYSSGSSSTHQDPSPSIGADISKGHGHQVQHRLPTSPMLQQSQKHETNKLQHQISSSSSDDRSGSLRSSTADLNQSSSLEQYGHRSSNLLPHSQQPGLVDHHHHQHQPSKQQLQQQQQLHHQHHQATHRAHGVLRKGYTSVVSSLGGSVTALNESLDLSPSHGSHMLYLTSSAGTSKRSGLRAPSPSAAFDSASTSGTGMASRHQHHHHSSSGTSKEAAGSRSESSTGLPSGGGGGSGSSTLTKKSNSATQLSMTGTKKRLGFRRKQVTSFSVHRSEEVAPLEARHLVKQGSSVSEGDSSMSGDSSSRSWSNSNFKQPTSDELASMNFIDGLGKGQMISRQGLASPYLGDIQLSLCDRRGNLEVEIIRARNLQAKTNKLLPLTYVKLYLVKNRKCLAKAKTTLSNKRTLDPLFQQQLTFHEDYHGCILQSIIWGNFGKMDKKNFMGIAQISIDDLELGETVISWYKLFLPSSLQTLPSKSLRHTLLSNSTESFTNTNNS